MKSLSIIIPSFNAELYLARCLDSLLYDADIIDLLDIIIVSDGSTDSTVSIAKNYQKQFEKTIKVIDKKNGGHGSTINEGLKVAKGKYVKILDSDDWFNIFDFSTFVKMLKNEDADIVITNYTREVLYEKTSRSFIFNSSPEHPKCDLSDAVREINNKDFFFKFSMPSMAIKTSALRQVWSQGLLEKTFYVDQQFVAKVLEGSKTYTLYPLDIYRHFIGRPDQSISSGGFFKHRKDHERVLKNLLSVYDSIADGATKTILKKQITLMIETHYNIYLEYPSLTRNELNELVAFDKFMRTKHAGFFTPGRRILRKRFSLSFIAKNLIKARSEHETK